MCSDMRKLVSSKDLRISKNSTRYLKENPRERKMKAQSSINSDVTDQKYRLDEHWRGSVGVQPHMNLVSPVARMG